MIKFKVIRPNTVGCTSSGEFETFKEFEYWLENKCERLADKGWQLTELSGSNSKSGTVEATHDYEADTLIIQWDTD